MYFFLSKLLDLHLFLLDVSLCNFDKGVLKAIQLEVELNLHDASFYLLNQGCELVHVDAGHHNDKFFTI